MSPIVAVDTLVKLNVSSLAVKPTVIETVPLLSVVLSTSATVMAVLIAAAAPFSV